MPNIIEELYYDLPSPEIPGSLERERILKEYSEMCSLIQKVYGPDFIDRLMELKEAMLGFQGVNHFTRGFSLGIRLMVEALTSATG